jgi:hypothetical protein
MNVRENTLLAVVLTLALALVTAQHATAGDDVSTFELTGTVTDAWCSESFGPLPGPCYLEVDLDGRAEEHRTAQLVCRGQIAKVCEIVPRGLRVVVIGQEAFTERRVLHLGMWLEPHR